jgi:uncharacterized protein YjbJ (UPF0337 family)
MSGGETTEHADATGKFKEAWGRAHDDDGVQQEGQLQQVDAQAGQDAREDFDDLEDTVRERSGEDVDPESTNTP